MKSEPNGVYVEEIRADRSSYSCYKRASRSKSYTYTHYVDCDLDPRSEEAGEWQPPKLALSKDAYLHIKVVGEL